MIDQKVIEAINLMRAAFPEPVMLIHKNRDILAANEAYIKIGGPVGVKCSSLGDKEMHKGCLANQALESKRPAFVKYEVNGKKAVAFWLPVVNYPDIYIHVSFGATIDYDRG